MRPEDSFISKKYYSTIVVVVFLFSLLNCSNEAGTGPQAGPGITSTTNECAAASWPSDLNLADTVISAAAHTGNKPTDKLCAINGVRGGGSSQGSSDTFSLAASGDVATMILTFSNKKVLNETGIDFIVFENAFVISDTSGRFMDPIIVDVSEDNVTWCGFNPNYTNSDETVYSSNATNWKNFAGLSPVLWNVDTNPLSASDIFIDVNSDNQMDLSGGDGFNLDSLQVSSGCSSASVLNIKTNGFTYLRLRAATSVINTDTGQLYVADSISNGPDIDGVIAKMLGQ